MSPGSSTEPALLLTSSIPARPKVLFSWDHVSYSSKASARDLRTRAVSLIGSPSRLALDRLILVLSEEEVSYD